MTERQLGIGVLNSLLKKLKRYIEEKTSKTDVAIAALAKYLDRGDRFFFRRKNDYY